MLAKAETQREWTADLSNKSGVSPRSLPSTDCLSRRPTTDTRLATHCNAKAALLAMIEVHTSLNHLDKECSEACVTKGTVATVQDWRIGTQACEDDEEILTEIMAPPSGGSSGMLQAVSIVPDGLDIELDFDCSSFGFWHDVGVDSYHPREGCAEEEADHWFISEENKLPWDL